MTKQEFETQLHAQGPGGAWTYFAIPFDVPAVFGSRARVSVKGTLNGAPFRSSIFPDGDGTFFMQTNRALLERAGARQGDVVRVVMERDDATVEVQVPPDLQSALEAHPEAKAGFERLTPKARLEYVTWLGEAKAETTRQRRLERALSGITARKRVYDIR